MNIVTALVITTPIVFGIIFLTTFFHRIAYRRTSDNIVKVAVTALILFLVAIIYPCYLGFPITQTTIFLYSIPGWLSLLVVSGLIGYFTGKSPEHKSDDQPLNEGKQKLTVYSTTLFFPGVAYNSELNEFKYTNYDYGGVLDISAETTDNLPDMTGNEDKKLVYQGNGIILFWKSGSWLMIEYPGGATHCVVVLAQIPHIHIEVPDNTVIEPVVANYFRDYVFGNATEFIDFSVIGESLLNAVLHHDSLSEKNYVDRQFIENITLAPTSIVIKMAEDVITKTVHERHVVAIREELSKRLKAISDIEEAKRILYG